MKSRIIIEIESSEIKPFVEDGEDYSKEQEEEWHDRIFKEVEDLIQHEDFEGQLLHNWKEDEPDYLNPKVQEFLDIGSLRISISHEKDVSKTD